MTIYITKTEKILFQEQVNQVESPPVAQFVPINPQIDEHLESPLHQFYAFHGEVIENTERID